MLKLQWRIGIACALLMMSLSPLQAAETFYKWVDEDGTTHYGTRPPNGVTSTAIKPKTGHSEPVNYSHAKDDSEEGGKSDEEKQAEAEQEFSMKDPDRCEAARQNKDVLQRFARIKVTQEDGSVTYLSEEEKQQKLDEANQAISEACE